MMRGKVLLCFSIMALIVLTGCFKGEQSLKDIDDPEDAEQVNNLNENDSPEEENEDVDENVNGNENDDETNEEEGDETVTRDLYLLDVNGMVVAQTFELPVPDSKEVATQVLEYLVKDGPVTNLLPSGFQAVLPEGTEVLSLNLQEDGILNVDLSEEFAEYKAEEEMKILEAMTHSLTQFDSVDKIKLQINGHPQTEMPVDGTPIEKGYSRANGINLVQSSTIDFIASEAVTMYYPTEHNDNHYYVPVTQHVEDKDDDLYSAIVDALIEGPGYDVNVSHVFNDETLLTEQPTLSDGVLELEFNEEILSDIDQSIIADDVMETLTRTLTEQRSVEAIQVKIEDMEELVNEDGEMYNEPVTTNTFESAEKM